MNNFVIVLSWIHSITLLLTFAVRTERKTYNIGSASLLLLWVWCFPERLEKRGYLGLEGALF